MTFKSATLALLLVLSGAAWAQGDQVQADWREGEVPPPPAFDPGKLLTFEVSSNSLLVYGVDPATLRISANGVVRYVMVATSASGASNVFYEGIRCATAEVKTYARYSPAGGWRQVANAEWSSLSDSKQSRYAFRLARSGACDNAAPPTSVRDMIRQLKDGNFSR